MVVLIGGCRRPEDISLLVVGAFLGEELTELVAVVVVEHAVGEDDEEVVGLYVVKVFDVGVQHGELLAACILEDDLLLRRTDLQHTAGASADNGNTVVVKTEHSHGETRGLSGTVGRTACGDGIEDLLIGYVAVATAVTAEVSGDVLDELLAGKALGGMAVADDEYTVGLVGLSFSWEDGIFLFRLLTEFKDGLWFVNLYSHNIM